MHNAAVMVLVRHLTRAGANVAVEEAVPELYAISEQGHIAERFMDLVVRWPSGKQYLIDVTIRSPFAKELRDAHTRPGAAAMGGERDKERWYGRAVRTLAIEQSGRLSVQAWQLMAELHRDASELGKLIAGTQRRTALRLAMARAELESEVARYDAIRCLAALGCMAVQSIGWTACSMGGGRGRTLQGVRSAWRLLRLLEVAGRSATT